MSENAVPAANGQPVESIRWAVVQFGIVSNTAGIVPFVNDQGKNMPQILRVVDTEQNATKLKNRLASQVSRLSRFASDSYVKSTPIYGVLAIVVGGNVGRKPMTEEQRKAAAERLAKGRRVRQGK